MTDYSNMKHGRSSVSPPTPNLPSWSDYADTLPTAQPSDWSTIVNGMPLYDNDTLSDCTICAPLHLIQIVTAFANNEIIATNDEAISTYSLFDGYVINNPATDQGGIISEVLLKWKTQGIIIGGTADKILAYVRLDPKNKTHIMQACMLLGPLIIGAQLPITAATQDTWTTPQSLTGNDAPGSWADHCMMVSGTNTTTLKLATWDVEKITDWGWWMTYVDEAWAVLHPTWVTNDKAPSGFPTTILVSDMAEIKFIPIG